MSRSVGDTLAHQLGVISTPEIIGHTITSQDKYILLGTDGLFEWLSNQALARAICESQDAGKSLSQTIDTLIQMSIQEWAKFGDQVDDITCILVNLQWA
jgi:serine/threonine protein phosphatase PrpC